MNESTLLFLHLLATLLMVGVIWFVQIVHYPLFALVGTEGFATYAEQHQFRTSLVVAGPMLIEAFSMALIASWYPARLATTSFAISVVLLLVIWLSTAFVQVPLHGAMNQGFSASRISWLVGTNWLRTFAWTVRGVLLAIICYREFVVSI